MKKLFKRLSVIMSALLFVTSLTACLPGNVTGKDDNNGQAQITPGADTSNPGDPDAADPDTQDSGYTSTSGAIPGTFAERVSGSYLGTDAYGEEVIVTIYNRYDNLYALAGYAEDEDLYSFWAVEIFPESPEDILDENKDSIEIGAMSFSVMSNLTRYWSSPVLGTLTIKDDGIEISGKDGNPFGFSDGKIALKRSDRVLGFDYDYGSDITGITFDPNKDLYGLWREKYSSEPYYIEFKEGETSGESIVYQKVAGREVYLAEGEFKADKKEISLMQSLISDGSPIQSDFGYEVDGDTLILDKDNGSFPFMSDYPENTNRLEFERVSWSDVPVAALYEPDDVTAINGGLTFTGPNGRVRDILVQFKATDKVLNNGSYFVQVGDVVFFRYFSAFGAPDDVYCFWADFLETEQLRDMGCIAYYDTRNGSSGIACNDLNAGEIYYLDGRFYTETFVTDDYSSVRYITRFWPDGSGSEIYTEEGDYDTILGIDDTNSVLAIDNFHQGSVYTADGTIYFNYMDTYQNEDVIGSKFIGRDLFAGLFNYSADGNTIIIKELEGTSGVTYELGKIDESKYGEYGYPRVCQITSFESDVYIGIAWFDGTDIELQDYLLVKVTPGMEDSLKIVQDGLPSEYDIISEPYFFINYDNEILFTDIKPEGEVCLSNGTYGDLVAYDGVFSAEVVKEDFIAEYPFDHKEGEIFTAFETAERVGDHIFVITAKASYYPEADEGWRQAYKWQGFSYYVYTGVDGTTKTEINPMG